MIDSSVPDEVKFEFQGTHIRSLAFRAQQLPNRLIR
jgi:hypothetical protein